MLRFAGSPFRAGRGPASSQILRLDAGRDSVVAQRLPPAPRATPLTRVNRSASIGSELLLNMIEMQLTYDVLRTIGFNTDPPPNDN